MKKILLVFVLLSWVYGSMEGQFHYHWNRVAGGKYYDYYEGCGYDQLGNIYALGSGRDSIFAETGSGNSTNLIYCKGISNFIVKYSETGNLIWKTTINGTSTHVANNILVMNNGDFYITGKFADSLLIDHAGNHIALFSNDLAAYIIKFNSNGIFRWAKKTNRVSSALGSSEGVSISADDDGNILLTGQYTGNWDFDPGAGVATLPTNTVDNTFIAKYDSSGSFKWVRRVDGALVNKPSQITSENNDIYITGIFSGTIDANPGAAVNNLISLGQEDLYLIKLDSAGNFRWANNFGTYGTDYSGYLKVDHSGNVMISGGFQGTFSLNSPSHFLFSNTIGPDGYIITFDTSGAYKWSSCFKGPSLEFGRLILVDNTNTIYCIGGFSNSVYLGSGTRIDTLTTTRLNDMFIARFNSNGIYQGAQKLGITADKAMSDAFFSPFNDIFIVGGFTDTLRFENATLNNIYYSRGGADANIFKLGRNPLTVELDKENTYQSIFPNPSEGIIQIETKSDGYAVITNLNGQTIWQGNVQVGFSTIDISAQMSGMYFLQYSNGRDIKNYKVIIQK